MEQPPTERTRSATEPRGRQAVVLGGSLAGLLAARVLADHFDHVTVLERGQFPELPQPRRGVPQDHHVHMLLRRGLQILNRLFPGLSREMVNLGAQTIDTAREIAILNYHGWSIRYPSRMRMLTFTRPLLDWCIYHRLNDHPHVSFVENRRATGLVTDCAGHTVTGVDCRVSGGESTVPQKSGRFRADLVVDATGRFSQLPKWLAERGYNHLQETIVDPSLGYSTRLYERPVEWTADWKALVLLGKPPEQTRGGILLPVEGGRWLVTLAGINNDYPPTDERSFLNFARTLRSPLLYDSIVDARPLSPISSFWSTKNQRRHYESLPEWPGGLIVVGDAACALNPIYAQGMTVAALEAACLDDLLARTKFSHTLPAAFGRRFQRELAQIHAVPWIMATGEDLRWPQTTGSHPDLFTRCVHWYLDGVVALATEREAIDRRFAEVIHLVKPPRTLLHPRVIVPVLGHSLREWWTNNESRQPPSDIYQSRKGVC